MNISVQKDEPLSLHTTLKVGGAAQWFTTVSTEQALVEAVAFAQQQGVAITILGGGSNVLPADQGVSGLVIHMGIKGVSAAVVGTSVVLTLGAGELLDEVVEHTVAQGWWGLENLSHIPGTVGAMPVQNVGAYGVETKDVLTEVRVFDVQTQSFTTLTAEACNFGYRDSIFKHEAGKRYIITAVSFKLSLEAHPQIAYRDLALWFAQHVPTQLAIREAVMKIRADKFPDWHIVGTAGSFFKNPVLREAQASALREQYPELPMFAGDNGAVKVSLGWILDKVLQLRGFKKGNISLYKEQALVLIAERGATSREVEDFANDIVQKIKNATDIDVAWEVTKLQ